jgi:hypothetical protein
VGGGLTSGAAITSPCISVTADGVPMNTIRSSNVDMNGAGGLSAADITLAKVDLKQCSTRTRADFNKSGTVTAADITLLKSIFNAAGSNTSCASYCP